MAPQPVRALFDVVSYRSTGGHMDSIAKGEIATDMSDDAVERHLGLGSVEKVSGKEAKAAEKAAEPATTDKAVVDMTVKELKAFVADKKLEGVDTKLNRDELIAAIDAALTRQAAGQTGAQTSADDGNDDAPEPELALKAEALGLTIEPGATREEIVAAIEAHEADASSQAG